MLTLLKLRPTLVVCCLLNTYFLFAQDSLRKPTSSLAAVLAVQITHPRYYDPTFSPDGKQMIFISIVEGKEQLFLSAVDNHRAAHQLTSDTSNHEDPAWSPDGKWLAYVLIRDSLEALALMDLSTHQTRILTPPAMRIIHPSWSKNSKQVFFCTDDDLHPPYKNTSEIYSLDISNGKFKSLISGGTNTFPVLSPDGTTIVFRKMLEGNNSEVFAANADGSNLRNLSNHPSFDGWPAWSPDGKWIAFGSNRNSNYQIFVMDKNGGNIFLVANTEGRATAPVWSPDGKTIYFTNCKKVDYGTDCNIYSAGVGFILNRK